MMIKSIFNYKYIKNLESIKEKFYSLGKIDSPLQDFEIVDITYMRKFMIVGYFPNCKNYWVKIKEFPYISEDKEYAQTCAEELLEKLKEEI